MSVWSLTNREKVKNYHRPSTATNSKKLGTRYSVTELTAILFSSGVEHFSLPIIGITVYIPQGFEWPYQKGFGKLLASKMPALDRVGSAHFW